MSTIESSQFTAKKEFTCNVCNKRFKRNKDLKSHSIIHLDAKPFVCSSCPEAFKHKASLKRHSLIHSGEKPFVCRVCAKSFRQKGSLNEHMLTHTGEKPHSCEVCNMGFTTKSNYARHLRTHLVSKPFTCNLCDKGFNVRAYLLRHYKVHEDCLDEIEDLLSDDLLGINPPDDLQDINPSDVLEDINTSEESVNLKSNEFVEKSHLDLQVPNVFVVNTDVTEVVDPTTKEYLCKLCNEKFKGFNNFKLHYLSHFPTEKSQIYACSFCTKSFKNRSTLSRHKLTHVQDRLACLLCGKSFYKLVNLQKHFKNHTEYLTEPRDIQSKDFIEESREYFKTHVLKKSFICNVCERTFQREIEFMHHSLVHKNLGPFVCDICNDKRKFQKLNELHEHYSTHDGSPCVCYVCNEPSESESNNSKNFDNYMECKFHKCNICHKCFHDVIFLKKHYSYHKNRRPYLIKLEI